MSAHVQTQANNATGTSVSVTLTLTPGNSVICALLTNVSLASLGGSISQTSGDTTSLAASINNVFYQAHYSKDNVVGGSTTFTFTWANSQQMLLYVVEVSGLKTSGSFDQSASNNENSSATQPSGTTGTLSQANEFCLATIDGDGSGSTSFVSFSNGFTLPTNGNQLGVAGLRSLLGYLVVTSSAGIGTTATTVDPLGANGLITTYEDAPAPVGVPFFTQLGARRV